MSREWKRVSKKKIHCARVVAVSSTADLLTYYLLLVEIPWVPERECERVTKNFGVGIFFFFVFGRMVFFLKRRETNFIFQWILYRKKLLIIFYFIFLFLTLKPLMITSVKRYLNVFSKITANLLYYRAAPTFFIRKNFQSVFVLLQVFCLKAKIKKTLRYDLQIQIYLCIK